MATDSLTGTGYRRKLWTSTPIHSRHAGESRNPVVSESFLDAGFRRHDDKRTCSELPEEI